MMDPTNFKNPTPVLYVHPEHLIDLAFDEVRKELRSAMNEHPTPMLSLHDGFGIMREENRELWDEICKKNPDLDRLMEEAVQCAAMPIRFMVDLLLPRVIARETYAPDTENEHDG